MKKTLALALFLAAGLAPAFAAGPPPSPQPPVPKIIVIDRNAILQLSKAGQDITRQVEAYNNQARNDLAGQAKALQAEGQALQQQIAILAPDVKAKRIAAFEAKQQAIQGLAQKKQAQIEGGIIQARTQMAQALDPIVRQITAERGANLVLDKSAVFFSTNNAFDATLDAINRLNAKLPTIKVNLVNPPTQGGAPRK